VKRPVVPRKQGEQELADLLKDPSRKIGGRQETEFNENGAEALPRLQVSGRFRALRGGDEAAGDEKVTQPVGGVLGGGEDDSPAIQEHGLRQLPLGYAEDSRRPVSADLGQDLREAYRGEAPSLIAFGITAPLRSA